FHAGDGDDDAGFLQGGEVVEEAVEAGDADVVDEGGFVAHHLGGDGGFAGDGEIGGAGGDDDDAAVAGLLGVGAVEIDGAGEGVVLEVADAFFGGAEMLGRGAGA